MKMKMRVPYENGTLFFKNRNLVFENNFFKKWAFFGKIGVFFLKLEFFSKMVVF